MILLSKHTKCYAKIRINRQKFKQAKVGDGRLTIWTGLVTDSGGEINGKVYGDR